MPIQPHSSPEDLTRSLSAALAPQAFDLLRDIAAEARRRRLPLYLVGGFVRDLLLGRPGLDFDLVVEGDAIGLAKAVAARLGGRTRSHDRFHTAQWFPPPERGLPDFLDFITARSESYAHPGALPTVRPGRMEDDLRRRDFTINTLALRLDGAHFGELRDDLGGLADLEYGVVRVLHPGSYRDDPTRIFRAFRYEQRYGFRLSPSDLEWIEAARPLVTALSADRVRNELNAIFAEPRAAEMLARLAGLGILTTIHPALAWDRGAGKRLGRGLAADPPAGWGKVPDLRRVPRREALGSLLWLARLDPAEIRSVDARLHFPAPLREALLAGAELIRLLPDLPGLRPSAVVARLEEFPPLVLYAGTELAGARPRAVLERYLREWRHVRAGVTGADLVRAGLESGPAYDHILTALRAGWLDGTVANQAQEADLLEKLLREIPPSPRKSGKITPNTKKGE